MADSREGRVAGLQRSAGGVPKLSIDEALVGSSGMDGDRQRDRRFHGGPMRALCLYSQERIDALAAEGHPIGRGSTGENVTVSGLDWSEVVPGTRLQLGEVEVEVTAYAAPCRNIAGAFIGGEFTRIGQKVHPGWSRVYTRILRGGRIIVGDRVVLTSATSAADQSS